MTSSSEFNYSIPFDMMVGIWTGLTIMYTERGEYISSAASNVVIYWKEPNKLMHFRQGKEEMLAGLTAARETLPKNDKASRSAKSPAHAILADKAKLATVAGVLTADFDLHISGKYATATSDTMNVTGVNSRPDVYLFHLRAKDHSQNWFNNQYFSNANERQIIGPQLDKDGEIQMVVAQTFSRISYDVPKKMISEIESAR